MKNLFASALATTTLLSALGILAGCNTGLGPTQPGASASPSSTTGSLIVQALTPICASTLRDKQVLPSQAAQFGIDEAAVCECGLRRVEAKVAANPAVILDVLKSTDAQINLLVQVGGECSAELIQKAILGNLSPSPTPTINPYPSNTPQPQPTFWPPAG